MSTNGGSMEDCHTNIFALTELNGLKWKCLTTPQSQRAWTSLEQDPVLSAYAKCLQAGILCAWRRQPPQTTATLTALPLPDYRIDVIKELWIFWFTPEQPEALADYTNHLACAEDGQGNWSIPGIQYETRILFFKALHNLIERNLLKNGYIRIGKYFTKPYETPSFERTQYSPRYVNAINFNFFVHGENTVCTTVSVQQQPTLFRLSRRHLELDKPQRVILGPWSLRAVLLPDQPQLETEHNENGNQPGSNVLSQPCLQQSETIPTITEGRNSSIRTISKAAIDKLWSEWLQFFCLIINDEKISTTADTVGYIGFSESKLKNDTSMPKMVLVDVDGVHMWYPSSLIVVQASDDLLLKNVEKKCTEDTENAGSSSSFTAETPPATTHPRLRRSPHFRKKCKLSNSENEDDNPSGERRYSMYDSMVSGACVSQRFFEEACIAPSSRRKENMESPSASGLGLLMSATSNEDDLRWNLTDGMRRKDRDENCTCRLCQSSFQMVVMNNASAQLSTVDSSPQDGCHAGINVGPSCSTPINMTEDFEDSDGRYRTYFHRRSPSCTRSPSPIRSPTWERRLAEANSDSESNKRLGNDWIREGNVPSSSAGVKRRSDTSQDDKHQCPKSPESSIMQLAELRKVNRVLRRTFGKVACLKPVYQNLSPTSRPRSPASNQQNDGNRDLNKENGDIGFQSNSSASKQLNDNDYKRGRKSKKCFQDSESGVFKCKRRRIEKLEWNAIENYDLLSMGCGIGESYERVAMNENQFVYSTEINIVAKVELSTNEANQCAKPSQSQESSMIKSLINAKHGHEMLLNSADPHREANLNGTSSICDAQSFSNGSTSNAMMSERRSPSEVAVTDSVHLSPPASNERVEPNVVFGGTVANMLARVGGPPSVGDYMIFPTPPSVDATQSQQFSPQNTLLQTNATLYPPSVQYIAASVTHTFSSQLSTIVEGDNSMENICVVKQECESNDQNTIKKLVQSVKKIPVYELFEKLEMALSGKFANDIFTKDFLSGSKEGRLMDGIHAEQMKSIAASVLLRKKRKRIGRVPDYISLRDRARNQQTQFSSVHQYRPPFSGSQLFQQHCSTNQQMSQMNMPMTGLPNYSNPPQSQFAPSSYYGTGGPMMNMMMAPGIMHSMPGMVQMGQQMPLAHIRPSTRMHSLPYSPQASGTQQHPSGFMNHHQSQFCSPPGMLTGVGQMPPGHIGPAQIPSTHLGQPTQLGPNQMASNQMCGISGPMQHMLMPPMNQYSNVQSQQPFQQLSHFVNNTNFSGNQTFNSPAHQQIYQHQLMYRGSMPGNLTSHHPMQHPGPYGVDSQMHAPLEQPSSFPQAINSPFSLQQANTGGMMFGGPSAQLMRPNMMQQQQQNMMGAPRMPTMTMQPPAVANTNPGMMFASRMMGSMTQMMDSTISMGMRSNPEGKSLVIAVLLQDTVLDLHYDALFDSCPICSCNGNIRAKELGIYITPPEILRQPPTQQQLIVSKPTSGFYNNTSNTCNCGFSAVRHRYLSMKSGLFPEDAKEATDITEIQNQPAIPHTIWFDSMSGRDMNFIALLREQTLEHDLGAIVDQLTMPSVQFDRACQLERICSDSTKPCEYIISEVDQRELPLVFQAACEVACMEMNCRRPMHDVRSVLLHDWGVQIANEIREPREAECMAVLQEISPILEESLRIARASPLFGSNNIVEGPLTWRFFDRKSSKAGTGMEDDSAPEPIPCIMTASEKDAIIASPQIIKMWEKIGLEPFDQPKDVLYICAVPDNLVCIEKTKKYLADLSSMYEQCRFGRHIPFAKDNLRDGLLRIPSRFLAANPGECDNFLNQVERHVGESKSLIARLKAYTQCFENEMARILLNNDCVFSRPTYCNLLCENQRNMVKNLNCSNDSSISTSSMEQMPPPSAPGGSKGSTPLNTTHQEPSYIGSQGSAGLNESSNADYNTTNENVLSNSLSMLCTDPDNFPSDEEKATLPHVIVLYLINPFLMGAEENPLVARVVTVALMRAFNAILYRLNNRRRPQLQLEIIALQNIFDYTAVTSDFLRDERWKFNACDQVRLKRAQCDRMTSNDALKTVAFSVYSQSRIILPDVLRGVLPKSMTRFGPASAMMDFLDELNKKEPIFYKVPSRPFVLAPPAPIMQRSNGVLMQINTDETVLFVSYCLIGNDWLAAAVTDHQGHLMDNCLINLRLKTEHKRVNMRYKQSTQIRDSLYRLWSYILGTVATGTKNWRLVIGRVGRIGHGEFKFWTQILNKSYLKQVGTRMKNSCRACHVMPCVSETPGILSACLVSLEPEAHLRIYPTSFQHDERFLKTSRYRTLFTPDDCSCTHILVFPTISELNLDHQGGSGAAELEEDDFSNLLTEEIGEEFSDLIGNGEDLMTNATGPPVSGSFRMGGNAGIPSEYADVSIENQPLATGYYISTAPASDLPDWFWSACPSAKRRNPIHLKSSLHLNTPNVQQGDDISSFGPKVSEACHHQLDSQATADVLRYVLETYNALSWLNVDFVTGERRSCLPVHIQALMRLCNTVNRFIN